MNKATRILMLVFGIVMIVSGAVKLAGALAEEATAVQLPDGSGGIVATLTVNDVYSEGEGQVTAAYTLTNRGEVALTQLNFNVGYLDESGDDIRGKMIYVMIGLMTEPLQPGQSRDFTRTHYFDGAERAVTAVLEPLGVKDEVELPPWTEPRPGNLLLDFCNYAPFSACFENLDENPPVEMVYRHGEEGEEVTTDVDAILAQIESLRNMRIGDEVDVMICDDEIWYAFTMADGTTWSVSFMAPGLFYWHGHVYEVINE